MRRVRKVAVQRQFKRCPTCGYTDGFHLTFSRDHEKSKKFHIHLICPMCSAIYDIGMQCDATDGG